MSGVGIQELLILFIIGLLILGPERLPRVATQIGRWVGKARRTANQLRYQLEREITLADIEEKKSRKKKDQPDTAPDSGPTIADPDRREAGSGDATSGEESVDASQDEGSHSDSADRTRDV